MLVLSRSEEESIIISTSDGSIVVKVVDIRGSVVRLAFQAPPSVAIHREEVQRRIDSAKDIRSSSS